MKENKPLSNEEIASFCGQTAMLFQAGIPPVESMHILLSDTKSSPGRHLSRKFWMSARQESLSGKPWKIQASFPSMLSRLLHWGRIRQS